MADEPDIPMLDVGDFEVLDECSIDEEQEDEYEEDFDRTDFHSDDDDGEHDDSKRRIHNSRSNERDDPNLDDNSGDIGDNVLDVNIDVSENEFLENVAKDFSENLEEEVSDCPRVLRSAKKGVAPASAQKKHVEKSEPETPASKKKPGPKSKTVNATVPVSPKKPIQKITFKEEEKKVVPTPKKPIQKITFNKEEFESKNKENKTENSKKTEIKVETKNENSNTNQKDSKVESKTTNSKSNAESKTPAFLQKKDLTDEEIMMHFDEIESTVLASDNFVIENELTENQIKDEMKPEVGDTVEENKESTPEENWDNFDNAPKKKPFKVEELEFAEHEMWYKDKLTLKKKLVDEKLVKLAKYIQYSYPQYKKWLDRNESTYGSPVCRMDPCQFLPLDQLRPNRWKFICNKKQIQQQSSEEEEKKEGSANTSDSKNAQFSWRVIPGVPDAKVDNPEEYPPFVMKVVKIFEEFLQSLEEKSAEVEVITIDEESENSSEVKKEGTEDKTAAKEEKPNDKTSIKNLDGLTILIRCNRKNHLMINITAKNITEDFLEQVKNLFESGPGKDSNVKSLYCKTIIKENNVIKTNNNFLWGSKTLEDNIGDVKIELTPESNLWINLAGFEVMAHVMIDLLSISKNTSVIEIGCGKGLLSLILAGNCQKIIGLDTNKEVQEAEKTSELNEIKNATFVTGKPKIVMGQIESALQNANAVAIINNNNSYGRSTEVLTAIRKMTSVTRIVVITNLTKASIRSVLDLTQPATKLLGNPFIPTRACIIDTTPKNQYGYEIAIAMERREMPNISSAPPTSVGLISKSKQEAFKQGGIVAIPGKKGAPAKFIKNFQVTAGFTGKKVFPNPKFNPAAKFQGKRPYPGSDDFQLGAKKLKPTDKPWQGSNIRPNPMYSRDESDLRERLSSGKGSEPQAIVQEMREQKKLLDAAKEKLTGVTTSVDSETVKKLQEMLNLAIEKTNKLQSQLPPRSVWDRIAPADSETKSKNPVKGPVARSVKETGPKEMVITTSNNRDTRLPSPGPKSKKYHNLPPLEPDHNIPDSKPSRFKAQSAMQKKQNTAPYQKPGPNRFQGKKSEPPSTNWGRGKPPPSHYESNQPSRTWGRSSPPRRPLSPPRQMKWSPPPRHSPPRRFSPPRRAASPPRRPMSPPRRPISPMRRLMSPVRRPLSPPRRPMSPGYRGGPPPSSRNMMGGGGGRMNSPPRGRRDSPPRRPISPPHNYRPSPPRQVPRQKSPPRRYADEWDIPSRGAVQESGWSRGPPNSASSGWNQGPPDNGRFRPENDKWVSGGNNSSWDKKGPSPAQNNTNRWKDPLPALMGSNWDVQTKEASMRDARNDFNPRPESRIEPRHEPRPEPRLEQRWEPPEKFRNEKEDWGELPEDARDPWGDDPPQKDPPRFNPPSQPSQQSWSSRDKPNDNWSSKNMFPSNNMMGGGPPNSGPQGGGMNSNMNMNIQSNKPSLWSGPPQQQQQGPGFRSSGWGQMTNNWPGHQSNPGMSNIGGGGLFGIGGSNSMNNWQSQPQPNQNFSNFSSRPMNNNPFMSGRR